MKLKLLILLLWATPTLSIAQNQTPQPFFKIGAGTSRVWVADIRSAQTASVGMSDFSEANYMIREFTVTVLSNETKTYKTIKNTGSNLNEEIRSMFSLLKSNDTIMIEDISATDPSGKTVYLAERIIRVR